MKKRLLFLSPVMLIALLVLANGPTTEDVTDKTTGSISYQEIKDKELVGYEPVYMQEEYSVELCDYESYDLGNLSEPCWDEIRYRTVVDSFKQGAPIYSYGEIKAIEYSGTRYDFIEKGCFICETVEFETGEIKAGKFLLCLSNYDGYQSNIKECWIEDGVDYQIKDLDTDKIIDSAKNSKVVIEG